MDETVTVLTETEFTTPERMAAALREYNKWRRGEGKYAWDENPNKNNAPCPFSPMELGILLDKASDTLESVK